MTFHSPNVGFNKRLLHLEPTVITLCSMYGAIGLIFVLGLVLG